MDSDDYFDDDDFVLDAATEAALAATERQYASQSQLPAAKKQRTDSGWAPRPPARTESFGDIDYPEISIQGDAYHASPRVDARPAPAPVQPRNTVIPPASRPYVPPRPQPQRNGSSSVAVQPQRPPLQNHRHSSTSRAASVSNYGRASPVPAAPAPDLQNQVQHLQQQLEAFRQSTARMQAELQDALDAKTARDGEVTILRKTMERTAQTHATELATLKNAKQEAEARQNQIQKNLKDDMERLKTQLTFKQQELEASLRKPPGSVRPKRTREPPATPVWNALSQRPNFVTDSQQTPSRPVFAPPPKLPSPKKSPSKTKRSVTLPGFQNSFATSTPLRPSQAKTLKGKEKEVFLDESNIFNPPAPPIPRPAFPSQAFLRSSPRKESKTEPIVPPSIPRWSPPPVESPVASQPLPADLDGDIVMGQNDQNEELIDEYDIIDPPNWKAELTRILLTHVRPRSSQLTLRELLAVAFTGQNDIEDGQQYAAVYVKIMGAVSHPTVLEDYDQCLQTVGDSFVSMAQLLTSHSQTSPLASLLNLLGTLSFFLPKFRSYLLGSVDQTSSPLIQTLCQMITANLGPGSVAELETDLGMEILNFLEIIAFELPDDDALKLSDLVRNRDVMMTLLHPAKSLPFLEQALRVFVLLSTRKPLCWSLLSLPNPDKVEQHEPTTRNGVTERLCSFLVEPAREGSEYYQFKETIMLYFSQLSVAHPNAYMTLSSLPLVLASIIWHITHLTTPLYEDDEALMESPKDASTLVQYIYQSVHFVNYLAIRDKPAGTLGYKLQQAPTRPFVNIQHMHIVAFGRLAAASPPDWLSKTDKRLLEEIKDMSYTILQDVVDGMELDGCFDAYSFGRAAGEPLMDEKDMEDQMTRTEVEEPHP